MRDPCCPPCRPWWISTKTYVAECAPGMAGIPVSVTRQGRSFVSQEDADNKAMEAARTEAIRELQCLFTSTQEWVTPCVAGSAISRTATSAVSQADANDKALKAAKDAAEALCA